MRYASVCDGIGAAHVAWQPLGWECAWTSEIEPFPSAVVDERWKLKNVGDMTKLTEEQLQHEGPISLLVGGTPCQSFSVAGLRKGLEDPRGNLALRFTQLVGVLRPTWVVWENVPGVLSSAGGRDFGTFLGALAELGYGFAYRVLDAQWFGVAQRRRRVFVVAHAGDWRRAAAVLFERESLFGNSPTRGETWQGVARSTASSLTRSGRGVERCGESRGQDDVVIVHDTCGTLCADKHPGGYSGQDAYQGRLVPIAFKENMSTPSWGVDQSETSQAENHHAVAFSERTRQHGSHLELESTDVTPAIRTGVNRQQGVIHSQAFTYSGYSNQPAWMTGDRTDCLPASGHSDSSHQGMGVLAFAQNQLGEVRTNTDIMGTVNTNQNASGRNTPMVAIAFDGGNQSVSDDIHHTLRIGRDSGDAIAFRENQRGEVQYVDPPHALASGGGKPGQGYCGVQQAMSVRRLTPRECERLQGFPDDYTLVTYRNKPAADGPRYKALGNSMAVPVMRWIGERIASVDSLDGAT
jgi:DNA (cytosine-5)-methyltransferase 1